jgi:hypothetical protein
MPNCFSAFRNTPFDSSGQRWPASMLLNSLDSGMRRNDGPGFDPRMLPLRWLLLCACALLAEAGFGNCCREPVDAFSDAHPCLNHSQSL